MMCHDVGGFDCERHCSMKQTNMNRRKISLVAMMVLLGVGLAFGKTSHGKTTFNTDSLLTVLDGIVAGREPIEENKQRSIAAAQHQLQQARGDEAMFDALGEVFAQYRKYRLDSALFYARKRVVVAQRIGIADSVAVATMNVVDGLKGLGRFQDGLDLLKSVPQSPYVKDSNYYYYLLHSITLSLYKEASDSEQAARYASLLRSYRDTISTVNADEPLGYTINMSEIFMDEKRYNAALGLLTDFGAENRELVARDAIYWCTLADVYGHLGNSEAKKYCLTMGAIIDKRNCVKTYTSLQDLALLLNEEGDSERAYRYITCAMGDIMAGNARSRLLQVSQYMPIILDAHAQVQRRIRANRITFDVVVGLLVLVLAVVLLYLHKRNCKLTEMRHRLDAKNQELVSLNEDLKVANSRLGESNKIKETYIAQLFKICTEYIDEMEKFRMSLARKLKAGQVADIKSVVSKPVTTDALKDFFRKFDMIFLELFPTFVEDFNKLLQPGAEIIPKEKDTLTTELRIYALVRLGINDSTKIAGFLHYSSQTVYNYRQKVRNRAIVPKDKFVEAVQNL